MKKKINLKFIWNKSFVNGESNFFQSMEGLHTLILYIVLINYKIAVSLSLFLTILIFNILFYCKWHNLNIIYLVEINSNIMTNNEGDKISQE